MTTQPTLSRSNGSRPVDHPLRRSTDPAPHPMRRAGDRTPSRLAVSLVVPALNEARNIPWVFEQIPECVGEVLLIDGDSHDATVRVATQILPEVRSIPQNGKGKGNALRTGFLAARGEYIVMLDADGSMSPGEIPHFVHFLENGYDFVKGSRFVEGGGSLDITRFRRLGNHALLALVNRLYDAHLTDLCYGFCAFRRSFLDQLDLHATGFEIETEMVVHALRAGLRIAEVPSLELPRRNGRSNLHAISDGRRVLRTLLSERPGARPATAPREGSAS
ncbi:glycosyltransferase family 2 protein [Streptomyces hydrogenans]|uniref:glycosyltransferase family 2 protein n=1 Tax=Streptomyces hydrogenans TaxID=1873719 RepID=UPI003D746436